MRGNKMVRVTSKGRVEEEGIGQALRPGVAYREA